LYILQVQTVATLSTHITAQRRKKLKQQRR